VLARLDPSHAQPLQRGNRGQRHGGGLLEGEIPRLGREPAVVDGDVLGEGAVAEAVHLITRLERRDGAADLLHHSGEVPARHRELGFAHAPQPCRAQQDRLAADEMPVPRVGRTGPHAHEHVLVTDDRHRHVGQRQDILWRAVPVLDHRLHRVPTRGLSRRIASTLAATEPDQVSQTGRRGPLLAAT
jgi:hypothetical protein